MSACDGALYRRDPRWAVNDEPKLLTYARGSPLSLSGGLLAWEGHSGLAKRFFEGRDDLEGGLFRHRALQFGLSLIGAPVGVLQPMEPVPILLGDTIFAAIHVRNILAHTGPWLKTAVSSFEEATPRGGVGPPTACCLLAGVGRESRQQGNNTPRWPPAGTASAPGLKREAGESPARSRHCDRGANPRDATGTGGPGKARGSGDPGVRRPASGVREPSLAYRRAARGQPPAERRRLFSKAPPEGRPERPRVRPGRWKAWPQPFAAFSRRPLRREQLRAVRTGRHGSEEQESHRRTGGQGPWPRSSSRCSWRDRRAQVPPSRRRLRPNRHRP